MAGAGSHLVVVESDQDGTFLRLPSGWLIETEDAEVRITSISERGGYLVQPLIGEDGLPNCRFVIPANEAQ